MGQLSNQRIAWFNGQFMAENQVMIPFRDRSWKYGDGAFDMTRTFEGQPFRLKEHIDRFYRSLRYLQTDPGIGPKEMVAASEEVVARNEHLRPACHRGVGHGRRQRRHHLRREYRSHGGDAGLLDRAVRGAALFAILLGFSPKFGALIHTIAMPVMGGVGIVVFGLIAVAGMRIWVDNRIDFTDSRNMMVAGITLMPGAGDFTLSFSAFSMAGIGTATFGALLLYGLPNLRK